MAIQNLPLLTKPSNTFRQNRHVPKVLQVVIDADCRCMIPGLMAVAKKLGFEVLKCPPGTMLVFINTRRNYIKTLHFNATLSPVMSAYRLAEGSIYDLRVIGEIPNAMLGNGRIDFDQALQLALEKVLGKKAKSNSRE